MTHSRLDLSALYENMTVDLVYRSRGKEALLLTDIVQVSLTGGQRSCSGAVSVYGYRLIHLAPYSDFEDSLANQLS
jgi:hypothetical protein